MGVDETENQNIAVLKEEFKIVCSLQLISMMILRKSENVSLSQPENQEIQENNLG